MPLTVSVPNLSIAPSSRLSDKLSDRRWHSYLMARKIRELRRMRGLTQQQLADHIGVNEAAIRNYETQKASPKKEHIDKMAEALGVRPEALRLYDMGAGDSITANVLFQIAEIYGFEPHTHPDYVFLMPLSDFMSEALQAWAIQYERLKTEKISDADYRLWKDCYSAEYDARAYPERYEDGPEGNPKLIDNWEAHCLSAKLRQLRASHDMTQSEFADFLGIKLGVYRSYEQGWRLPKVSVVELMAGKLGVTRGCLTFFDFGSPVQAIHALFQLSSEYGLRPDIVDEQPVLRTQTPGLEQIIDQWHDASNHTKADKSKLVDWKGHYEPDALENRLHYETRYTEPGADGSALTTCFSKRDPYDPRYRHGYLSA